jgi:hypothetical protein
MGLPLSSDLWMPRPRCGLFHLAAPIVARPGIFFFRAEKSRGKMGDILRGDKTHEMV